MRSLATTVGNEWQTPRRVHAAPVINVEDEMSERPVAKWLGVGALALVMAVVIGALVLVSDRYVHPAVVRIGGGAALLALITLLVGGVQWIRARPAGQRAGRVVGVVLGLVGMTAGLLVLMFAGALHQTCAKAEHQTGPLTVYACSSGFIAMSQDAAVHRSSTSLFLDKAATISCADATVTSFADGRVTVDNAACPTFNGLFVVH